MDEANRLISAPEQTGELLVITGAEGVSLTTTLAKEETPVQPFTVTLTE